jgi:hypothetical protein
MKGVKSCWSRGWGDRRAGEGIKADRRLRGIRYVRINLRFSLFLRFSDGIDKKGGEVKQSGDGKMNLEDERR